MMLDADEETIFQRRWSFIFFLFHSLGKIRTWIRSTDIGFGRFIPRPLFSLARVKEKEN
jgi:hypothetical protein